MRRSENGYQERIVGGVAEGLQGPRGSDRGEAGGEPTQRELKEIYGTDVSPQFMTTVTGGVVESLEARRNRELETVYPIVFFDAIVAKVRDNGHVLTN